jgi:hypothetical protein
MKRLLPAIVLVLVACGSASTPSALPNPTPPTTALAKWRDFPAQANPRPIIAFGDTVEYIPAAGFPDNGRKVAWLCNKFVLAPGVRLSSAPPAMASATGAYYPAIGSARAWAELMASRSVGANSNDCAAQRPFDVTSVRWATAAFSTDRGMMLMSAWLFDVPEVNAYIGHAALDPSAFWGKALSKSGRGGVISADGLSVKIAVGDAQPGPCGADYTTAVAESPAAVAIAIKRIPHASPGAMVACPAIYRIGFITAMLSAPLAGRVLVDQDGNAGAACPENGAC